MTYHAFPHLRGSVETISHEQEIVELILPDVGQLFCLSPGGTFMSITISPRLKGLSARAFSAYIITEVTL